jgi:hypothetical protein
MPKGLAMPVGVSPTGGALLVEGSENDNKIVMLALGDDSNDNAFEQDRGLGVAMLFDFNDPAARPQIMSRLRRVFDRFKLQKRYELVEDSITWLTNYEDKTVEEGSLVLEFRYLSLEANEERLLRTRTLTAQGTGR